MKDDQLLHLLENGLASLTLSTALLLTRDLPRRRAVRYLQSMRSQVQYLSLVAQAWAFQKRLQCNKLACKLEAIAPQEILSQALRSYERDQMGIAVRGSPGLPRVRGDREWLVFVLRSLVHTAVMQGQRCHIEAEVPGLEPYVRISYRRHGEPLNPLSATATRLLLKTGSQLVEKSGGHLTVRDAHRHNWRAVMELPWAAPQATP